MEVAGGPGWVEEESEQGSTWGLRLGCRAETPSLVKSSFSLQHHRFVSSALTLTLGSKTPPQQCSLSALHCASLSDQFGGLVGPSYIPSFGSIPPGVTG